MIAKNGPVIRLRSAIVREKTNLSPQNGEITGSALSIQLKLQEKRSITEIPRATHLRQMLGLNKRRKRDD